MSCKVTVTTEELLFLAVTMEAKYLDYDFYEGIDTFKNQYNQKKRLWLRDLEEKEILELEGRGRIRLSDEVRELLKTVFFGESESEIRTKRGIHRFYFLGDSVTYVRKEGKNIHLIEGNQEQLNQIINRMEALNEVNEKILIDKTAIDMSQIKETILLRNRTVGQTANVQELIVVNDCYLTSVTEKKAVYLDNESLRYLCRQILWVE